MVRNNTAPPVASWQRGALRGRIATLQPGLGTAGGRARAWLTGTALPGAVEHPGVVAGHLLEGDAGVSTAAKSDEKKLLATPDALVRWVVLVEGIDPAAIEATCRDLLSAEALARRGATDDVTLGLYRLQLVSGISGRVREGNRGHSGLSAVGRRGPFLGPRIG